MTSGSAILFLTFIGSTLGSNCSINVTPECSCEQHTPSLVNIHCSFAGQDNITQTLVQNSSSSPPIKIHVLDIAGSNLTSLPSSFLEGVESINRVDFSHNLFPDVPPCLQMVNNVTVINLSYNQIKSVNLSELHTQGLDISHNVLSEVHLCDIFPKQMDFLNISQNNIEEIPQNLWMVAENLDISFNHISHLSNAASSSTKYLYLRGNSLQTIPDNWFLGLKDLIAVDISQNQMKSLTNKTFIGLSTLLDLQMSQNQLSDLGEGVFQNMFLLRNLSLNENKIRELRASTFKGLEESLAELRIGKNELETIASDTFKNLLDLHHLDLSDNVKIRTVDHVSFPPHLTLLNLSHCNLQQIEDCKFFKSYDLQHLDLSNNNLTCSCHLSWLYLKFGSRRQAGQQTSDPQWTCHMADDNIIQQVQDDLSLCLSDSFGVHHCRILNPEDVNITILVSADKNGILATWEIQPESAIALSEGFKVSYASEDGSFQSPVLDKTKRLFMFDHVEESGGFTICVHLLENATTTLKQTCHLVVKENYQIIIGILAGVVFLVPCIAAMTYILLKDRRMMYRRVNTEVDNCCDEHKQKNGLEVTAAAQNDVEKTTMVRHNGKTPSAEPCVQVSVSVVCEVPAVKRLHGVETPLDVKRLEDVETSLPTTDAEVETPLDVKRLEDVNMSLPTTDTDLAVINRGYISDSEVFNPDNVNTHHAVVENSQIKTVTRL
ncbi:leucine-rich repeats and immunoglobulin-like domains protein 2 [Gigantopelta aegis]|uniref:leucine-rich repeats and immunoglobulin-like domains protein 2 n=1 Tax=Gigantopelta aegis TaxID=1735272 RepID=UPI001B888AB9|nr:leucine-rich repeats and immunoglobulin-like domains protein 2 [Gigantopelta aegis]